MFSALSTTQLILAVDFENTFDNVYRNNTLEELQAPNCGARTYNYVRRFLRGLAYCLSFGGASSPNHNTQRGIPRGSVACSCQPDHAREFITLQ